jgi:hypothetical protein
MKQKPNIIINIAIFLTVVILLISILPVLGVSAQSPTLTFKPDSDSYVNQSNPTTNYGTSKSLLVDNSPFVHSYLRFTVSGLNGSAIQSARLRVYANSSNTTGFTINKLADNSWTETNLTYSNAPAPGAIIASSAAISAGNWVEVDLSSYVQSEGSYNLVVTTTSTTNTNLASRESGTNAPQLVVTLSGGTQVTSTPGSSPTQTPTQRPTPTIAPTQPAGSNDPIIFFTGDLVSSNSLSRAQKVVSLIKTLMGQHTGTQMRVASTGDNEQENNPTVANYKAYFGASYGSFVNQGIFMQVRGNHDIQSAGSYTDYNGTVHSSGAAYWDYFGANAHLFNIAGQKLTDYSYNLGNWHIIALDQLNGNVNNATLNFLNSDLAAHTAQACQIVYWHVPTYSSGSLHGDATGLKTLNQAEYNYGVDIQLNGHDHDYQRFYPIDPNGVRDDAKGITTFIDGIGGQDGRAGSKTSLAQAASAVYMDAFPGGEAIGVIQFTLHPSSADYALYDGNTGAIIEQGTIPCH